MRGSGVEGEPPATSPQPPLQSGGYPEQATLLVPGSNQPGIATNPQHRQVEDYSLPRFKTDRVFDVHSLWIWEILSFAAAGVLYGVFFFLLFQYDGQRVAQWEEDSPISQLFRTLQSAISFLTTLMKAAILLPVASAIGQLKWHYMRHPRRLKDLELIDGASRGGLGAVRLLFSRSSLHSTSFGCLIIVGAVLLGPFIQNTVQVQTKLFSEQTLSNGLTPLLPVTNEVITEGPANNEPGASSVGLVMLSSIQAGWAAAAKSVDIRTTQLTYKCPFDYCEWTNFTTLGVGARCRDADVNTRRHPTTDVLYAFSNEADLNNLVNVTLIADGTPIYNEYLTRLRIVARTTVPPQSGFAQRAKTLPLIIHFAALGAHNGTYHATECILYWAAHHYPFFALNSTLEVLPSPPTEYNTTTPSSNPEDPIPISGPTTCAFNRTLTPCTYSIRPAIHRGMRDLLIPFLTDTSDSYPLSIPPDLPTARALNFAKPQIELFYGDWIDRLIRASFSPSTTSPLTRQSTRFLTTLAEYITNNIRSNSGGRYVFGTGGSVAAYFEINKRYAAYPSVVFAAAVGFVAVTAWRTRGGGMGGWKNSVLAVVFHGLEGGERVGVEGGGGEGGRVELGTVKGMEEAAGRMVVGLREGRDGVVRLRASGGW